MNQTTELIARNRAKQAELYGEPLGDMLARLMHSLDLTQARVARVLGLSAPMLSQLASGQRVKIGNPVAVQRLQALSNFAQEVAAGEATLADLDARLAEIGTQAAIFTQTSPAGRVAPAVAVRTVQSLLRTVASADQLHAAADQLADQQPQLAEFLRVFGTGRTAEGVAFYEAHEDLMG